MKIKVCGMRDADNIRALIQLPIDYIGFIFYEKSARYVEVMPDVMDFNAIKKVGVFVNADIDFVLNKISEFGLQVVQLHGKETPQYLKELKIKKLKLNPKYSQLLSKLDLIGGELNIHDSKLKILRQGFLMDHYTLSGLTPDVADSKSKLKTIKDRLDIQISKMKIIENDIGRNRAKMQIIASELEKINPELEIWKAFSVDEQFDFNTTKPYQQVADKFLFDTKTPLHGGSGQKFNWDLLKKYTGETPFFLSGGISAADTEGVKNIRHPQFLGLDLNSKFEILPALKDVQMLDNFISSVHFL